VRGAHEAAAGFHQAETGGLAVLEDDVAAEDDVAEVEVICFEEQKICTLTGSEMSLVSPSVEIGDVRRGDLGRSLETYNARTGEVGSSRLRRVRGSAKCCRLSLS
jgi:hypothetical protein